MGLIALAFVAAFFVSGSISGAGADVGEGPSVATPTTGGSVSPTLAPTASPAHSSEDGGGDISAWGLITGIVGGLVVGGGGGLLLGRRT